jgi:hypothetical protein
MDPDRARLRALVRDDATERRAGGVGAVLGGRRRGPAGEPLRSVSTAAAPSRAGRAWVARREVRRSEQRTAAAETKTTSRWVVDRVRSAHSSRMT